MAMNLMKDNEHLIWAEKYSPTTLSEYVFQSSKQKRIFEEAVADKCLPGHMLFYGVQGTGKTTLAELLIKELKVDEKDVFMVKASDDNSVEFFRDQVKSFISAFPHGEFRVVVLDEADFISLPAQAVLRKYMENPNNPTRFILTCNYVNKMMPALRSRCQQYRFNAMDRDDVTEFVASVLISEGVKFDLDLLDQYVAVGYPDVRAICNLLQPNCIGGKLEPFEETGTSKDFLFELLPLLQNGKWVQARQLLCKNVSPDEWEDVYRFIYENITTCFKEEQVEESLIVVAEHLYYHAIVADPEINAAAMVAKLSQLK